MQCLSFDVWLETVERLAAAYNLEAWQLLSPTLDQLIKYAWRFTQVCFGLRNKGGKIPAPSVARLIIARIWNGPGPPESRYTDSALRFSASKAIQYR